MQKTDKIKILIAQDETTAKAAKEYFNSQNNFEVVGATSNGNEAINLITSTNPDVVLLELILQDKDGISVLDFIKNKLTYAPKPKAIVFTNLVQDSFIQRSMQMGAYYYMAKPSDFDKVKERIVDVVNLEEVENQTTSISAQYGAVIQNPEFENTNFVSKTQNAQPQEKSMRSKVIDEKISSIFIYVGIPANIKGYQFLREAVKLTIEKPELINSVTKQLYPSIAEHFETSPSKVERAIRHAIEVAWNRGKISNLNSVFGMQVYGTNEKPTNSEFIALIADKMLLEGA